MDPDSNPVHCEVEQARHRLGQQILNGRLHKLTGSGITLRIDGDPIHLLGLARAGEDRTGLRDSELSGSPVQPGVTEG
ncbi:hypothetical protein [Streptomyces sp. NPDC026589]|uniref:hypothetical protein n=1 Tax=Streptomyces sp. NPDC026589 TaxID=3155609 RepID=UPI00340F4FAB